MMGTYILTKKDTGEVLLRVSEKEAPERIQQFWDKNAGRLREEDVIAHIEEDSMIALVGDEKELPDGVTAPAITKPDRKGRKPHQTQPAKIPRIRGGTFYKFHIFDSPPTETFDTMEQLKDHLQCVGTLTEPLRCYQGQELTIELKVIPIVKPKKGG